MLEWSRDGIDRFRALVAELEMVVQRDMIQERDEKYERALKAFHEEMEDYEAKMSDYRSALSSFEAQRRAVDAIEDADARSLAVEDLLTKLPIAPLEPKWPTLEFPPKFRFPPAIVGHLFLQRCGLSRKERASVICAAASLIRSSNEYRAALGVHKNFQEVCRLCRVRHFRRAKFKASKVIKGSAKRKGKCD
jgi:hypothetical protein